MRSPKRSVMIRIKPTRRPTGRSHASERFGRGAEAGREGSEEVDDVRSSKDISVLFEIGLKGREATGVTLREPQGRSEKMLVLGHKKDGR